MQWKSKEKQEQVTKIRAKEKNKMNNLRNGESLETVHTHTHTHTQALYIQSLYYKLLKDVLKKDTSLKADYKEDIIEKIYSETNLNTAINKKDRLFSKSRKQSYANNASCAQQ